MLAIGLLCIVTGNGPIKLCDTHCKINGVPAESKREMALCRHMRVSRPSGLSAGQWWLLTLVIAEANRHRKMSQSYSEWIRQTTSYDSPWTLLFLCQKYRRHSDEITSTGAPNKGGVGSNWRFSTNISLYLRNSARYGHTCYGRLIGTVCTLSNGAIFNDLLGWPLATPNDPIFYILQHLYISVTGEVGHLKFGGWVYHSMSQPVGDKPSLKGA